MSSRTLIFENIADGTSIYNMDSVEGPRRMATWPFWPVNASGAARKAIVKKGRYGQTIGNPINPDKWPETPTCPYHMPRNPDRYKETRLTLNQKAVGDIIEARDINNLIEKIKTFSYVWEAEANNIYNYPGVSGSNRIAVNHDSLIRITNSQDSHADGFEIKDPKKLGGMGVDILLYKPIQIFTEMGQTENEVRLKLINAMNKKVRTGINLNNPLPHSFPEYLDDIVTGNASVESKYTILNGGFAPLVGVKAVHPSQLGTGPVTYYLKYTSGKFQDKYVKDKNGDTLKFKSFEPYIFSFRPDNQPDTLLQYGGFILYHSDFVIDNNTLTVTKVNKTYVQPTKTIETRDDVDMSWKSVGTKIPTAETTPISIDIKSALTNTPTSSYLWQYVDSKANFLTWLNSLPSTTIKLPKFRINGSNYEYYNGSTWIPCDGIYWLSMVTPFMKTWETIETVPPPSGSPAGTPPTTKTITHKQYGFAIETQLHDPLNGVFKSNFDINNDTFLRNPDGGYSFNSKIFGTAKDCMELLLINTNFQDTGNGDFAITLRENIVGVFNEDTTQDEFYNSSGIRVNQNYYRYRLGINCPPGSTKVDDRCVIETTTSEDFVGGVKSETPEYAIITEYDITYKTFAESTGTGTYPLIKATDYRNIRNVLNRYLERILNIARTGINNGNSDPITANEIDTFFSTQEAMGVTPDKDNPDTSFLGYHAYTGTIIKVEFYNVLLEAYKIIINSCLCNADCACNVNCICNVNCGCDY